MLIRVATIGYAREPDFEVHPPGTPFTRERIAWALLSRKVFRDACEKEGIDLSYAKRLVERAGKGRRDGTEAEELKSRNRSKL